MEQLVFERATFYFETVNGALKVTLPCTTHTCVRELPLSLSPLESFEARTRRLEVFPRHRLCATRPAALDSFPLQRFGKKTCPPNCAICARAHGNVKWLPQETAAKETLYVQKRKIKKKIKKN